MRMRIGSGLRHRRLTLATLAILGCGTPAASRRESVLWREVHRAAVQHDGEPVRLGDGVLDRTTLVREVLRRNPDVTAAREALRAALAEVPRARAFDDPVLSYEVAPLSAVGD